MVVWNSMSLKFIITLLDVVKQHVCFISCLIIFELLFFIKKLSKVELSRMVRAIPDLEIQLFSQTFDNFMN